MLLTINRSLCLRGQQSNNIINIPKVGVSQRGQLNKRISPQFCIDQNNSGDEYLRQMNEADSVWKLKPWWCQPSTIVLSGFGGVGFFWLVTGGNLWITTPVALLVILWWYLFLIIYPQQFKEYVQQMNRQNDLWNQER